MWSRAPDDPAKKGRNDLRYHIVHPNFHSHIILEISQSEYRRQEFFRAFSINQPVTEFGYIERSPNIKILHVPNGYYKNVGLLIVALCWRVSALFYFTSTTN